MSEPVVSPTEARQASPRRMNLRVLAWSMTLAIIAAAILYFGVYGARQGPIGLPKEQPATSAPQPGKGLPPTGREEMQPRPAQPPNP